MDGVREICVDTGLHIPIHLFIQHLGLIHDLLFGHGLDVTAAIVASTLTGQSSHPLSFEKDL